MPQRKEETQMIAEEEEYNSYNPFDGQKNSWGHPMTWGGPTQNNSNLQGPKFYSYLKSKSISDESICALTTQGIDSMCQLRECSQ